MKRFVQTIVLCIFVCTHLLNAQDFSPTPVPFAPDNQIVFKMNLPITHLDINNFVPSTRGLFAGQSVTFKLYNRVYPWTDPALFMRIRWDSDLDAANGITWTGWFQDQNEDAFATVARTYSSPGRYTVTFEVECYTPDGRQAYARQKRYDIVVAPMPTAVYRDSHNNQLFYWAGADGLLDKPVLVPEGFDPDNSNTPGINYGLAFDIIEPARSLGYDPFIMEWANGGADLALNRDVFLGACKFVHDLLGGTEAALQVVGISMGGTIARYGLAWAEDMDASAGHPGQYIDHFVNTFISFDAPQQGGHLNTGMQNFLKDNGNSQQQLTLQCTAAQQMLYNDVFGSSHDAFYTRMNLLHNNDPLAGYTNGYPRRCKNFAISNANRNADYPTYSTATPLAVITEYAHVNILDIASLPIPTTQVSINAEYRDIWPGSTFPHDLSTLSSIGFKNILTGFLTFVAQAGGGMMFDVKFNPSYTPTESAIDLDGYTRAADGSLIGGTSWFDDHLLQTAFHRHEEVTPESKNKVLEWLNTNRLNVYLGRPTDLQVAAPVTGPEIHLTFNDNAAFESGFHVERKPDGGSYVRIATTGPNQTEYVDADPSLRAFKTYYYRVRSYGASSVSPYSDEVSVCYQPHLLSSSASAVGGGAQHRLLQTESSVLNVYMAYESGGGAFLTRQFPADGSWYGEELIGGVPGSSIRYRFPSLNLDSTGAHLQVAYDRYDAANSTHTIKLDYYNDGVAGRPAFSPLLTLDTFTGGPEIAAAPAVAISRTGGSNPVSLLAAVWPTGSSLMMGLAAWNPTVSVPTIWPHYDYSAADLKPLLSGSSLATATNPTVAVNLTGPLWKKVYAIYLLWEESGGIRFMSGVYLPNHSSPNWPPSPSRIVWDNNGVVMHVADNTAEQRNTRPSLALDASGKIFIAWQFRDDTYPDAPVSSIKVQKRASPTSVSATYEILRRMGSGITALSPSLTDYRCNAGDLGGWITLAFETNNGLVDAQYDPSTGAWSEPELIDRLATGGGSSAVLTQSAYDPTRSVAYVQSASGGYKLSTATMPAASFLTLLSPVDGAAGLLLPLTVSWSRVNGATRYELQIATSPSFSAWTMVLDDPNVSSTSYELCGLLAYGETYYWRVAAVTPLGEGPLTAVHSFTTGPPPGGVLPAPALSLTVYSDSSSGNGYPNLAWSPVAGARGYQLYSYRCAYGAGDCQDISSTESPSSLSSSATGGAPNGRQISPLTGVGGGGSGGCGGAHGTLVAMTTGTSFLDRSVRVWSSGGATGASPYTVFYYVVALDGYCQPSEQSCRKSIGVVGDANLRQGQQAGNEERRKGGDAPAVTCLRGNYPNPCNPATMISYALAEEAFVSLKVFNVLGQEVRALVGQVQPAGWREVEFDGADLPSGLYFYRLEVIPLAGGTPGRFGQYCATKKMVLAK